MLASDEEVGPGDTLGRLHGWRLERSDDYVQPVVRRDEQRVKRSLNRERESLSGLGSVLTVSLGKLSVTTTKTHQCYSSRLSDADISNEISGLPFVCEYGKRELWASRQRASIRPNTPSRNQ